jgi:hypothetical protein
VKDRGFCQSEFVTFWRAFENKQKWGEHASYYFWGSIEYPPKIVWGGVQGGPGGAPPEHPQTVLEGSKDPQTVLGAPWPHMSAYVCWVPGVRAPGLVGFVGFVRFVFRFRRVFVWFLAAFLNFPQELSCTILRLLSGSHVRILDFRF